jgi:hypothetical protein
MSDTRQPATPLPPRVSTGAIGRTWRVIGLLVFLVGITGISQPIIVGALRVIGDVWPIAVEPLTVAMLNTFFRVACVFTGGYFAIHGRQLRSRACTQAVLADPRPPVVYLRTFKSERSIIRTLLLGTVTLTWYFEIFYSEEEQLAEAVNDIGPFIAIGKPGEALPKLGAARIYVRDEVWKGTIHDRLQQAGLVIVLAGEGEGLWWEIGESFRTVQPSQLLILFLRMRRKTYNKFAERVKNEFGKALPRVAERPGKISGILTFDSNWQPITLALKAPTLRVTVSKPLRALYAYALRPVFAKLDISWVAPPISAAKLISIAVLLVFVALTVKSCI